MFICTECESPHKTFNGAANCHFGIGGVMTMAEYEEELNKEKERPTFRLTV